VETAKVAEWENGLFEYLRSRNGELLGRIATGYWDETDVATLKEALKGYKG
jgi:hypothetical protein